MLPKQALYRLSYTPKLVLVQGYAPRSTAYRTVALLLSYTSLLVASVGFEPTTRSSSNYCYYQTELRSHLAPVQGNDPCFVVLEATYRPAATGTMTV